MCIIERLFSSSLVAVVELAHPRKLRACHFKVSQNCVLQYNIECSNTAVIIIMYNAHHHSIVYMHVNIYISVEISMCGLLKQIEVFFIFL